MQKVVTIVLTFPKAKKATMNTCMAPTINGHIRNVASDTNTSALLMKGMNLSEVNRMDSWPGSPTFPWKRLPSSSAVRPEYEQKLAWITLSLISSAQFCWVDYNLPRYAYFGSSNIEIASLKVAGSFGALRDLLYLTASLMLSMSNISLNSLFFTL